MKRARTLILALFSISILFSIFLWCWADGSFEISVEASQWFVSAFVCAFEYRFVCVFEDITSAVYLVIVYVRIEWYICHFAEITRKIRGIVAECSAQAWQCAVLVVIILDKVYYRAKQVAVFSFSFCVLCAFVENRACQIQSGFDFDDWWIVLKLL